MKRLVFAAFALGACTPATPPQSPAPADPLAVSYEVRVDQTALPNVRSVRITGPDIELIEFRQGGSPNVSVLTPGRVGRLKLDIATDWEAQETTMEAWRASIVSPGPTLTPARRDISITITGAGLAPAVYTFQRCLPTTHVMDLGGQPAAARQFWSVTCESFQRS